MTCKLNSLFSIGEDFDDEDILGTDWTGCSASGPAGLAAAAAAAPSCALRAPSVPHTEPEKTCHQQSGERLAGLCNGTTSRSSTYSATAQTVALGFPQLSSSSQSPPHPPTTLDSSQPNLAQQQSSARSKGVLQPCVAQDDFDDWDVDLADLDEIDSQMGQVCKPSASIPSAATVEPSSSAKTLRPSSCGGSQTLPNRTLRELNNAHKTPSSSNYSAPPRTALLSPSPQSPAVFRGITAPSPPPSTFSRTLNLPQQPQQSWTTPRASPQAHSLFETVSPAPSVKSHPLHTPVLTNRLVQLVSASSKIPRKRPRSEAHQPRTRRFPGPAGLLPQQPQGQNLDEIVVSAPQTPAHGVVARLPSQGSSSQTEDDEFSSGAWAAMKTEMGLDERNTSCFLHTYSVVMVLRKAALKQLVRNKVPNMAVLLKSIVHTHADAKVVFKDPTGEIQGTVHRRLLEDRAEELKVGAVLLLKQVGVFSPSHRNHYLNVTPNNLLRIYSPDGVCLSSTQLVLEPVMTPAAVAPSVLQEPVSQMQLMLDEEDDEEKEGDKHAERAEDPRVQTHAEGTESVSSSRGRQQSAGNSAPPDADWDADDDLDELLGELSEDTYSF